MYLSTYICINIYVYLGRQKPYDFGFCIPFKRIEYNCDIITYCCYTAAIRRYTANIMKITHPVFPILDEWVMHCVNHNGCT